MPIITLYNEVRGVFGGYTLMRRTIYVGDSPMIVWKRWYVIL